MPQPELKPEEWQNLLDRYKIVFERPITPNKWPKEYAKIFGVIRNISRIWMQDYEKDASNDFDILPLGDKKARAAQLVNSARHCLTTFKNEDDWRELTEDKIFARFYSEVICRTCRNYFWLSDFEACTGDENAVRSLEQDRRRRRICRCNHVDRAPMDIGDDGGHILFSSKRKTKIMHLDTQELEGEPLRVQEPDRVIGLRLTRTIAERIAADRFRKNTHTPFSGKDVLYPFVVVEAKREKGPVAGFSGIEHQSAFPIRTCLRLQQNLQQETGIDLQCLVWFFAFRGEEWRVYGAAPDGDKTRIFDLWHGTILSEDGALQLCLIVDYVCHWARKEYRESILACLAAGSGFIRRFTTPMSSQWSEPEIQSRRLDTESLSTRSPVWRSLDNGVGPGQAETNFPDAMEIYDTINTENHSQHASADQEDVHHWSRWVVAEDNSPPWTKWATIRHSNLIQYAYQQLHLPENGQTLRRCLEVCFPKSDVTDTAKRLLTTLLDEDVSITASAGIFSQPNSPATDTSTVIRAFLSIRTQMSSKDWQIEQRILCISCTEEARRQLSQLAQQSPDDVVFDVHNCECLSRVLNWFQFIHGKELASLALASLPDRQMCIKFCQRFDGEYHFKLHKFHAGDNGRLNLRDIDAISRALASDKEIQEHKAEFHIPFRVSPQFPPLEVLVGAPDMLDLGTSAGVLVKKPQNWPTETPEFCFLVMDKDVNFTDQPKLADMIRETLERKTVFGIRKQIEKQDKVLIDRWVRILQGKIPDSTPLR